VLEQLYGRNTVQILDIGCGNGYVASRLAELGHSLIGLDVSPDGIEVARSSYPNVLFRVASVYEERLADMVVERIDCVIALEVVEHLFWPRKWRVMVDTLNSFRRRRLHV
jgi:2-polyprenyl-3-methyl-5-hydroxy-6-metoxy-1,4-benzoquinol methylase